MEDEALAGATEAEGCLPGAPDWGLAGTDQSWVLSPELLPVQVVVGVVEEMNMDPHPSILCVCSSSSFSLIYSCCCCCCCRFLWLLIVSSIAVVDVIRHLTLPFRYRTILLCFILLPVIPIIPISISRWRCCICSCERVLHLDFHFPTVRVVIGVILMLLALLRLCEE